MTPKKPSQQSLTWSDIAKKIVYAGVGSAVLAKEVVSDTNRQMVSGLISRAEKRKDDVLEMLAREVSKFLAKINVSEELARALQGMIINLTASVEFKPKNKKGINPTIKIHSATAHKK